MPDQPLTAYDVTGRYDDAYFEDLSARYLRRNRFARQRIKNVFSMLPPLEGRAFLDIGCGMGTFAIEAAKKGATSTGLDMMPQALSAARRVALKEHATTAHFVQGDAVRMPLPDSSIDVALAADLTEHLDDTTLDGMLRATARVLRPGGTLVLYTPESSHIFERLRARGLLLEQDPSHIGIRTAKDLAAAVRRAGLDVKSIRFLPSHIPVFQLIEKALGRWVPLLRRRIGIIARKPK
jgi:ubiquinone/menaquinone biosynthesis C-methylase UbiE